KTVAIPASVYTPWTLRGSFECVDRVKVRQIGEREYGPIYQNLDHSGDKPPKSTRGTASSPVLGLFDRH
ncbi:hypothetical protein BGZ65_004009, partial [Modicella reniformis]